MFTLVCILALFTYVPITHGALCPTAETVGLINSHCKIYYNKPGSTSTNVYCTCQKPLQVKYVDYPPYIYYDGTNTRGIWKVMIEAFADKVCSNTPGFDVTFDRISSTTAKTSGKLVSHCASNDMCDLAVPIVGPEWSEEQLDQKYNALYTLEGLALITIKDEEWKRVGKSFGNGIVKTWPVYLFVIIGALLSGMIMWVLDTWWNPEQFPRTFLRGTYEGFWWSYVSMTTVGYGDKTPAGTLGRVFAVFWIIIGIIIVSILTSILSRAFSEAVIITEVKMTDNKIGHLDVTSYEKAVILREKGIPIAAEDIYELERMITSGEIDAIALDSRQLEYFYKTRWSKMLDITWKYQNLYKYNQVFGFTLYKIFTDDTNNPNDLNHDIIAEDWRLCADAYYTKNKDKQELMEGEYRDTEAVNMQILEPETSDASLFDTDSHEFKNMLMYTGIFVLVLILLGIAFDMFWKYYGGNLDENGIGRNAGYIEEGKSRIELDENMSVEEKAVALIVDKTIQNSERRMKETEKAIRFDIMEMSRTIRREIIQKKDEFNIEKR